MVPGVRTRPAWPKILLNCKSGYVVKTCPGADLVPGIRTRPARSVAEVAAMREHHRRAGCLDGRDHLFVTL
jgi:hypothetical protein